MMSSGESIPTAIGESGMVWFVADDIGELQDHLRYHYSRRLFAAETVNGTLLVGVTVPEDVTEPDTEPILRMHNAGVYEAPLHRGSGCVVTRLPPRDHLHMLYRETRATDSQDHCSVRDYHGTDDAGVVTADAE